jgi:WD40 repeat protein
MIIPNTRTLAFDPSGEYLVAAGLNGDILIANLKNQRIRTLIANKGNTADRFTFSKSGNLLATSSANQLQILSIPDGKPIQNLKATSIPPGPMALASDGACLAVAGEKEGILLWKNYSTSRTRLPPGEYKILVEKNGHQLLKENVILRAGNSITMEAHSNDTFPLAQMGTIQ